MSGIYLPVFCSFMSKSRLSIVRRAQRNRRRGVGHRGGWRGLGFPPAKRRNHPHDQRAGLEDFLFGNAPIDFKIGCQPEFLLMLAADGLRGFWHHPIAGISGKKSIGQERPIIFQIANKLPLARLVRNSRSFNVTLAQNTNGSRVKTENARRVGQPLILDGN